MKIYIEQPSDYQSVREMVKRAFETAEHTDGNEHNLVESLRASDGFVKELSLVAKQGDEIIGHIIFTKAMLGETPCLALAPLSVSPDSQKQGVGKTLIAKGHETAKALGFDIVVVLGSDRYYPKFGYKPASGFGIKAPFEIEDRFFMATSLSGKSYNFNETIKYVNEIFEG